jgi:hypothetical protein
MNDLVADKRDALAKKILLAAIHGWTFGRLNAAKAAQDCYALADEVLKEGERLREADRRAAMVPLSRAGNVSLSAAARVYPDDEPPGSTA